MTKQRKRILLVIGAIIVGMFIFSTILDSELKNIQIENQNRKIEELSKKIEQLEENNNDEMIQKNKENIGFIEVELQRIENNIFDMSSQLKKRGLIK